MSCGRENREVCRCSVDGEKPLSLAVIDCVSEADGGDPDNRPPLYEAVDPEALDNLFRERNDVEVTFLYLDYEITVKADTVVTRQTDEQLVSAD